MNKKSSMFPHRMTARSGFTLIEVLVVIAIIGILASIILVGLSGARRQSQDAERISDLRQTANALELYYTACGRYPGGVNCAAGDPSDWTALQNALTGSSLGVNTVPDDPVPTQSYAFGVAANGQSYILRAQLSSPQHAALQDDADSVFGIDCSDSQGYYCFRL